MKRLLVSFCTVLVSIAIFAGNVTEQQALTIARQFMQGKTFQQKQVRRAAAVGDNQFYVFNAEGQNGFVIVSADDRTIPVLGYADKGSLELDKLPLNARKWLEGYAEQIKSLKADVQTKYVPRRAIGEAVEPLLTSQWDQYAPYNLQCPKDGEDFSLTGCVATAMAQIMYYHKWPQTATANIPAYTTNSRHISVPALEPTTFKWDKMKDKYDGSETDESADAVAELMRYCGQSVKMDYTSEESGSNVYASTWVKYFGYSKTAKEVSRASYSTTEWEKMIYNEVANHRPVIYSGFTHQSGHEFVIHGYDGQGLFYVNWGWGGYCDGAFSLSILNPEGRGAGGGTSSSGYSIGQGAIIGIQPDNGEASGVTNVSYKSNLGTETYTRTSSSEDFTNVEAGGSIFFWDADDIVVDHAWVLYKGDERIKVLDVQSNLTVKTGGYNCWVNTTLTFGADLPDGVYLLRQMTSAPGANQWDYCQNYDGNILLAEITGNTLKLKLSGKLENTVKINNVTLSDKKEVNRPMMVTVNWTNLGYNNENTFFVWLGTQSKAVGAASSFLSNGETGDVEIAFLPTVAGATTLKISTDEKGYNIVYEEEINIQEVLPQYLSATLTIEGERNYTIEGTTINATVEFVNNGTNNYNDDIVFYLYELDEDGAFVGDPVEVVKQLSLAADASGNVNVQFPNLKAGTEYYIYVGYYSEGLPQYFGPYSCTVGKTLVAYNLTVSATLQNTNGTDGSGNTIVEGIPAKMTINVKNNSTSTYKDKLNIITFYDNNNTWKYVKTQVLNVEIPAGQTKEFKDYELEELEIGKVYLVNIRYYSENLETYACRSPYFTITEGGPTPDPDPEPQSSPVDDVSLVVTNINTTEVGSQDIEGTTAEIDIRLQNNGAAAHNFRLDVVTYQINADQTLTEVKTQYINVEMAAGETKTLQHEITELQIGKSYRVYLYYFTPEYDQQQAGIISQFNMVEASGINLLRQDKAVDVYTLQGNKVRTNATSICGLPKGVYIINGKKVVLK